MGLRCTLLGHAHGEPVTEREREKRGDEEVVTTRKIRTCSRCGAETVLSENTEVRYLGSDTGERVSESPAAEPKSDPEPVHEPTRGKQQPEAEPATGTGQPAESEPDVADLVESAESDSPRGTPQATDPTEPEPTEASKSRTQETRESGTQESSEPETRETPEPETTEGIESDTVEPVESETESAPATKSPEPETTDTEADEGIILDETSDRDPTPETAGLEDSDEYSALSASDEPARPDQSNEADTIDDIEDRSESDAESAGPGGPAADTQETEPTDATASTEEPDSMFGGGSDQPDTEQRSPSAETGADSQSDPWKERPPTTDPEDSGEAEYEWDDPTFQYGLQEEASGPESAEQGTRGPAGIKSEGPLDVDSEPDSTFNSLVCPECGFSESAQTSLRAGDICPECHRGYLAGRR